LQSDIDAFGDLSEEFDPFAEEELEEESDMAATEEHVRIHMALGELDGLPTGPRRNSFFDY